MAAIRAIYKRHDHRPGPGNTYYWLVTFTGMPLDGSDEFFDLNVEVLVNDTDTPAVVAGKIIDAAVAGVVARQPVDTLARTSVILPQLIRGS